MYDTVPIVVPAVVSSFGCTAVGASECSVPPAGRARSILARPKSRILACPRGVTKMFAGLRSRWTIPFEWADSRASAIWVPRSRSEPSSNGPLRIRSASVSPSRSSMAMKCCPSCSSIACTVQMPGWLRAEAARASRWKRERESASWASSAGRNLSATCRPSLVSSASYTTPMPPLPSFDVTR